MSCPYSDFLDLTLDILDDLLADQYEMSRSSFFDSLYLNIISFIPSFKQYHTIYINKSIIILDDLDDSSSIISIFLLLECYMTIKFNIHNKDKQHIQRVSKLFDSNWNNLV